jgi:DNA-binding transcriptional MerR regulator
MQQAKQDTTSRVKPAMERRKELLTIAQVSSISKINVGTLQDYIREFKTYIPVKKGPSNTRLFSPDAVARLKRIDNLRNRGTAGDEIVKLLQREIKGAKTRLDNKSDLVLMSLPEARDLLDKRGVVAVIEGQIADIFQYLQKQSEWDEYLGGEVKKLKSEISYLRRQVHALEKGWGLPTSETPEKKS